MCLWRVRNIFQTRIIDLETIEIELEKKENELKVNIYDKDEFEKAFSITIEEKIKTGKKIKLFN